MKKLKNQSWTVVTKSALETRFLGKKLLEKYSDYDIFCLYGNLGAGKTQLVQGMGKSLGIRGIKSPTYTIIREHRLRPLRCKPLCAVFYHIDLYRVECGGVPLLGLEEIFDTEKKIIAVEWAEKFGKNLPKKRVDVFIEDTGRNVRKFTVIHCHS